eukprot:8910326-Alexandrium_andersonii.AAC.1
MGATTVPVVARAVSSVPAWAGAQLTRRRRSKSRARSAGGGARILLPVEGLVGHHGYGARP